MFLVSKIQSSNSQAPEYPRRNQNKSVKPINTNDHVSISDPV